MKIAIINDTHFGARNDNTHFNEYFYQFYESVFFPYLAQHNIKTCIHLGDLMDRRKFVSYKTAKDFRERFILPFTTLKIDLHIMIGNHDTYSEAQEVQFDGTKILFLPWINNQNTIYSEGMIDETEAQICMGHLEIAGFEMMKGMKNEHGLSKALFNKFDTVFSGHFHHKSDDGQIFYLGAPYEIYWNDCNDKKGFHIFDTETRSLERIINPFTIHKKIYYDDSQNNYSNYNFKDCRDKFIKLIVVNKKDLFQFDQFVDKLLKADSHDVKIIEDYSDLGANTVSDDIVENTEDTMTLLSKYIKELDTSLDKNRLINYQRQLYTEAQDLEI